MILDKQNLFSEDQEVTDSAASTNIIDLGAVTNNVAGTPTTPHLKGGTRGRIRAQVTTAFETLTSLQVSVQVDTIEAFSSPKTILLGEDIAQASLVAGAVLIDVAIPAEVDERYLRLYYTVTGTTATAGAVLAGITMDQQVS